jgi:HEPN domain-containing protein
MTPEIDPTLPAAWLARARGDMALAQGGRQIPGVFFEDLCFHAQQAAEKALKSVCVQRNVDFPRTHSLIALMDLLRSAAVNIPLDVQNADILTQFAVRTRYPGWIEPVTHQEYQQAVSLAQAVISWAELEIAPPT